MQCFGSAFFGALFWLASVLPAQSEDWTGAFIGAHGAYVFQNGTLFFDNGNATTPGPLQNTELDGAVFGGQLGYRHQAGKYVFGVVGDYSTGRTDDLTNNADLGNDPAGSCCRELIDIDAKHLASLRGTLGYTFGNILVFGAAGIGYAKYEFSVDGRGNIGAGNGPTEFGKIETSKFGVVVGGGVEVKFNSLVSMGVEYLHFDVGKVINIPNDDDAPFIPGADPGDVLKLNNVDVIKLSVNIKLGQL